MKKYLLILLLSFSNVSVFAQSKNGISISTSISEKKVTISPNPAVSDAKILIEGSQVVIKSVSVYSIIGSEVFSKSYNSPAASIDLNVRNFKKGKYLVRVTFEDNSSEVVTLIKH